MGNSEIDVLSVYDLSVSRMRKSGAFALGKAKDYLRYSV